MTYQVGDGNTNETIQIGRSGQPLQIGGTAATTVGFFAATPVAQQAGAAQAAMTLTTGTAGGIGFVNTTGFTDLIAQVEEIRASLVAYGLLKGSA